jgi:hypothetical protein
MNINSVKIFLIFIFSSLLVACSGEEEAKTAETTNTQTEIQKEEMTEASKVSFRWSYAGPVSGMTCVQWTETADPHTWSDNYLCSDSNLAMKWNSAGAISGMQCTQIKETADPNTWHDNYLCVPNDSPLQLKWSSAGPLSGMQCVQITEPADPHTWNDNYLCH